MAEDEKDFSYVLGYFQAALARAECDPIDGRALLLRGSWTWWSIIASGKTVEERRRDLIITQLNNCLKKI
ncbi:MAG TPA: hypothetical protein PLZ42_00095 [Methanothrix sp.]|nr:hypothetical protein [Methanothrix sp.]